MRFSLNLKGRGFTRVNSTELQLNRDKNRYRQTEKDILKEREKLKLGMEGKVS